MKTVAFIPARGGSTSIKSKNIMPIGGKPLIYWTLQACELAPSIDKTYVSTDSEEIKTAVEKMNFSKIEVIERSEQSATNEASSEIALLEFCEKYDFEEVVFLQATSPLTTGEDIELAYNKFKAEGADSLISVVRRHQFLWDIQGNPLNYDPLKRPRRQDWDGYYIENGAFYISKRNKILESKCRISGKLSFWEMGQKTIYEVDKVEDWQIIEAFLPRA